VPTHASAHEENVAAPRKQRARGASGKEVHGAG